MAKAKRPTMDELAEMKKTLPPLSTVAVDPKEMVKCPHCSNLWDDEIDASACCEDENEKYFVCPVCTKDSKRRLTDYSDGVFEDEEECLEHIEDKHSPYNANPYIEALRFGTPPLGEWVETMKAEVEFLIP